MSRADIENWCKQTAGYTMEQKATKKNKPVVTIDHFKETRRWLDINVNQRQIQLKTIIAELKALKNGVIGRQRTDSNFLSLFSGGELNGETTSSIRRH